MGLWDSVTGFFSDLGDFFSGKDFFEAAGYAWNDMMKLAADVLTKNPSSGTYKDVWENIIMAQLSRQKFDVFIMN